MTRLTDTMRPQTVSGAWECVFPLHPHQAAGHMLNVGAGRGGLSWLLRESGYYDEVTSIDFHPEHFAVDGVGCVFADLSHPLPSPMALSTSF
jgi:hypothetical protein